MEYLNLYDNDGNLLNEKGIRGVKTDNLIGIAIIFIQNSNGEFLIQKTSPSRKSIFATTGGHVTYGSTFKETIIREVAEELGVDISKDEVVEINTFIKEHYIQKVFYLKKDLDINEITIQEDEVEFIDWFSKEKISELISNNKFRESNIEGYECIINNKALNKTLL